MENKPKSCALCGKESTKKCSRCKQVYYCSQEHHKVHWKIHKKECAGMKQQKEEEEKTHLQLKCAVCGISESLAHLKLCAKCQMIAYCGEDCQLEHWRNGDHRSTCPKVDGLRKDLSSKFATLASKTSKYSQFHGDSRFQQLEQDLENGAKRRWLRHALELSVFLAEANIGYGQFNLGLFYNHGFGVMQDVEEAVKWYRKAADQGDYRAQVNLGECYYKGEGVPKDPSEAVKCYRKAADQGDANAQYNLGTCYYIGDGVPKDPSEAVKWYHKAADQGLAHAQHNLGECYYNGEGVPQDWSKAVKWYRKAADQGLAHAQGGLGICYFSGEGVPMDMSEAVKWWQKAADQGSALDQNKLGTSYEKGEGVPQDWSKAVKWYRKAADQGHAPAQTNLGVCYYYGKGVPKDLSEAVKWYRKAIDQGDANAQCNLGTCYYNGEGVPKDLNEATKWYRKSAAQGFDVAIEALKILKQGVRLVHAVPDNRTTAIWFASSAQTEYLANHQAPNLSALQF